MFALVSMIGRVVTCRCVSQSTQSRLRYWRHMKTHVHDSQSRMNTLPLVGPTTIVHRLQSSIVSESQ